MDIRRMNVIKAGELGRPLAHVIFSACFVYDIVYNGASFSWDNAGIFAVGTFGGEAILALASIRYGVANGLPGNTSFKVGNPQILEGDGLGVGGADCDAGYMESNHVEARKRPARRGISRTGTSKRP